MDNKPSRQPLPRKQFFDDVVRPGRTPASPNSRPVLPSNRPPVQDTSMKPSAPPVLAGAPQTQPAPQPQVMPPVTRPVQPAPQVSMPPRPTATPPVQSVQSPVLTEQHHPASEQSAPVAEPKHDAPAPHGRHSIWSEVLAVVAIVLLIGIILNILVDADVLDLPIPHTNFFDY